MKLKPGKLAPTLVVVLALVGCTSASTTPTPAPTSAPAINTGPSPAAAPVAGGASPVASAAVPSPSALVSASPAISASPVASPSAVQEVENVTISYAAPSVSDISFQAAMAKGFFQQQGINVNWVLMNADTSVAALNAGEIDFTDSPGNVILGASHGLDQKVLMFDWKESPWILVGKQQYTSIQDLRGKVVATSQAGSAPTLYLRAALQQAGMTMDDISPIYTGGTVQTYNALLAGQVDAGIVSPPYDSQAESQAPGLHLIQNLGSLLQVPYVGLGTSTKVLQTREPVAVRVIRALIDATQYLKANPDEMANLIATNVQVPQDVAQATANELAPLLADDYTPTVEGVQQGLDLQGQVSGQPVNVTPQLVIDTDPLQQALSQGS